jgi:hypothetical protein
MALLSKAPKAPGAFFRPPHPFVHSPKSTRIKPMKWHDWDVRYIRFYLSVIGIAIMIVYVVFFR